MSYMQQKFLCSTVWNSKLPLFWNLETQLGNLNEIRTKKKCFPIWTEEKFQFEYCFLKFVKFIWKPVRILYETVKMWIFHIFSFCCKILQNGFGYLCFFPFIKLMKSTGLNLSNKLWKNLRYFLGVSLELLGHNWSDF